MVDAVVNVGDVVVRVGHVVVRVGDVVVVVVVVVEGGGGAVRVIVCPKTAGDMDSADRKLAAAAYLGMFTIWLLLLLIKYTILPCAIER